MCTTTGCPGVAEGPGASSRCRRAKARSALLVRMRLAHESRLPGLILKGKGLRGSCTMMTAVCLVGRGKSPMNFASSDDRHHMIAFLNSSKL